MTPLLRRFDDRDELHAYVWGGCMTNFITFGDLCLDINKVLMFRLVKDMQYPNRDHVTIYIGGRPGPHVIRAWVSDAAFTPLAQYIETQRLSIGDA